jgi:hypothetical protein
MKYAIDIPNFGDFADPRLTAQIARDMEPDAPPYDVLVAGVTPVHDRTRAAEMAAKMAEAGATWWTERINTGRGDLTEMRRRIDAGPARG